MLPGGRPMNPIIVDPGVNFRSQLKRLFPRKQSKKGCRVSVETLYKKPLRLSEVQCITTEHAHTVTNGKPIKAHHFILRWLNGSKRASKFLPKSSPPPHEYLDISCTLDRKWSFTQSVLEIENQPPPDYPDNSNLFLKLGRCEKDDDTSWKVRYAVECVDSISHSQSEHCKDAGPQDYLVHHVGLTKPSTKPQLSTLENDFQHFYSRLTPFTLSLGSNRGARIRDLIVADTWEDLFSETANVTGDATGNMPACGGTGVSRATGITVSRRRGHDDHDQHPAPTTPEGGGRSGAGPSKLIRPTSLLDPLLLAEVAAWEIDRLHERNSIELTPRGVESALRREVVAAVSNFDVDFQSGGTSNVEWRRSRLGDTIPAERIILPTSESIGIKKYSDNGTVSGRSYNGGVARTSQASGAVNQKLLLKRGRDDDDRDEGKKRKKKDQGPQNPSGPSLKDAETFSCPFKGHNSPAVKHSCSTKFPNLSKVKEHLRRVHFQHLQCPHNPCDYCAGSPFEINRHQKQKHPLELAPIEQTINFNHLQKHKALKLKKLTWNAISQICFSMDYTRKLLDRASDNEDDGGNPEGDASETDQDNEVPGIVNRSTSTTDSGDEVFPKDDESEEKPEQQWDSAPTEARPHDYTPGGNPLPKGVVLIIHNQFEAMERKFTPRIISHLETHSSFGLNNIDIYKEIDAVFEGLDQVADNYSKLLSAPQTNFPGCFDGQQTFTMPASQLNYAESSYQNLHPVHSPFPTSPQTYQGPSADFGIPTPMNSKQGNVASDDLDDWKSNDLLLDLEPQPHLGLFPGSEFINEHVWR